MSKKRNFGLFCFSFLRTNIMFYLGYILCMGLVALTFLLYDVQFKSYRDALLFSLTFIIIFTSVLVLKEWQKNKQLDRVLRQRHLSSIVDLPKASSNNERTYQQIIEKFLIERQDLISEQQLMNQELKDYYGLWTHQIKTPLAALDLLVQTLDDSEQSLMKPELFKIDNYLNMMLTYIKLNHVNEDLVLVPVCMDSMVKEVIKKYQPFFIQKDLSVLLDVSNWEITTDKKWFSFILEQIIFNAIKYTKSGSITICKIGESLVVQDTGKGILPEDLPRIFENGYTGFNGHENKKASGLGLYMSKVVADRLGVDLDIESDVGKGTSVSFTVRQDDYSINPAISNLTLL